MLVRGNVWTRLHGSHLEEIRKVTDKINLAGTLMLIPNHNFSSVCAIFQKHKAVLLSTEREMNKSWSACSNCLAR